MATSARFLPALVRAEEHCRVPLRAPFGRAQCRVAGVVEQRHVGARADENRRGHEAALAARAHERSVAAIVQRVHVHTVPLEQLAHGLGAAARTKPRARPSGSQRKAACRRGPLWPRCPRRRRAGSARCRVRHRRSKCAAASSCFCPSHRAWRRGHEQEVDGARHVAALGLQRALAVEEARARRLAQRLDGGRGDGRRRGGGGRGGRESARCSAAAAQSQGAHEREHLSCILTRNLSLLLLVKGGCALALRPHPGSKGLRRARAGRPRTWLANLELGDLALGWPTSLANLGR